MIHELFQGFENSEYIARMPDEGAAKTIAKNRQPGRELRLRSRPRNQWLCVVEEETRSVGDLRPITLENYN